MNIRNFVYYINFRKCKMKWQYDNENLCNIDKTSYAMKDIYIDRVYMNAFMISRIAFVIVRN